MRVHFIGILFARVARAGTVLALLAGCTSAALLSEIQGEGSSSTGFVYHLPKTLLKITVTQIYLPAGVQEISRAHFLTWTKAAYYGKVESSGALEVHTCREGLPKVDRPWTLQDFDCRLQYKSGLWPNGVSEISFESVKQGNDVGHKFYAHYRDVHILGHTMEVTAETKSDPSHRYILSYQQNGFFDDRLCVGRNSSGLLQTVQYAGDDRTQEIAFNVIRAATTFLAQPTAAATKQFAVKEDDPRRSNQRSVEWVVDPWNWVPSGDEGGRLRNPDLEALHQRMKAVFVKQDAIAPPEISLSGAFEVLLSSLQRITEDECGYDDQCRQRLVRELISPACDEDQVRMAPTNSTT